MDDLRKEKESYVRIINENTLGFVSATCHLHNCYKQKSWKTIMHTSQNLFVCNTNICTITSYCTLIHSFPLFVHEYPKKYIYPITHTLYYYNDSMIIMVMMSVLFFIVVS